MFAVFAWQMRRLAVPGGLISWLQADATGCWLMRWLLADVMAAGCARPYDRQTLDLENVLIYKPT